MVLLVFIKIKLERKKEREREHTGSDRPGYYWASRKPGLLVWSFFLISKIDLFVIPRGYPPLCFNFIKKN
jgi:hypothetical protein